MLLPIHEAVVRLDELPTECDQLLELLRMEIVPLKYWQLLLGEYLKKGDVANFSKLLEASIDPEIQTVDQYMTSQTEISDQVGLLSVAVCHFANQAAASSSVSVGQELMSRARQLLARSESLVVLDMRNILAKGYLYMAHYMVSRDAEDLVRAMKQFDHVVSQQRSGMALVMARRGRGGVLYLMKQYSKALEEYRSVLRALGSDRTDNSVRLAICACQFHLGKLDKAVEALVTVLSHSTDSRAVCLAVSFLPQLHKTNQLGLLCHLQSVDFAEARLEQLVLLSVAALLSGQVLEAERAAKLGLAECGGGSGMRQILELVLGGALHSMGDLKGALRHYKQAAVLPSGVIGIAQCAGEETAAEILDELDKVRQKYPMEIQVLKLHAYLTSVVTKKPLDVDVLMEKAQSLQEDQDAVLLQLSLNSQLQLSMTSAAL